MGEIGVQYPAKAIGFPHHQSAQIVYGSIHSPI